MIKNSELKFKPQPALGFSQRVKKHLDEDGDAAVAAAAWEVVTERLNERSADAARADEF